MRVEKRDGRIVEFDKSKISAAILKAMRAGNTYSEKMANNIADEIEKELQEADKDIITIKEIENLVFYKLIAHKQKLTAKSYEGYRSIREFQRNNKNSVDGELEELLSGNSDYWNNENSNKNAKLVTTQRDYMAGIVSKDISRRFLIPPDIIQANDDGILYFHDIDYFGQNALSNCCLVNLEDMLQNGTVINGVKIDKPHRLITATTLASQILTAVSSSQYGGVTITLSHLAPFVRDSYNRYIEKYRKRGFGDVDVEKFAKEDLKKEIEDSVQTFNYQINSMTTTNG